MIYREIANEFFSAEHRGVTAREIAAWAIDSERWKPQRGHQIDQCARALARAMREEYFTDPQGRRVRLKHAARLVQEGQQRSLWADMRDADHRHMQVAFQQRRQMILSDCRQLKTDVDSYNENRVPDEPVQIVFDFTVDLEELEAEAA